MDVEQLKQFLEGCWYCSEKGKYAVVCATGDL
jgi:hypothetical protein